MNRALVVGVMMIAVTGTVVAVDMPTLQSQTLPMSKSVVAARGAVAVPVGTEVIRTSPRTIAVLEVIGNPATGEVTVKQVPILDPNGQPKQNELFSQADASCSNCNNPGVGTSRSLRLDLTYVPVDPRYICAAELVIASASPTVTGLANQQWEGTTPLPEDLLITGDTYFTFEALLNDNTQPFGVYVDIQGLVSATECGQSGDLAFRLVWEGTADLDIYTTGPAGAGCTTIYYANPSSCGGALDLDANAGCGTVAPTPTENIFWAAPPAGTYEYWGRAWSLCSDVEPVPYTLYVLVNNSIVESHSGFLTAVGGETPHYFFTYP